MHDGARAAVPIGHARASTSRVPHPQDCSGCTRIDIYSFRSSIRFIGWPRRANRRCHTAPCPVLHHRRRSFIARASRGNANSAGVERGVGRARGAAEQRFAVRVGRTLAHAIPTHGVLWAALAPAIENKYGAWRARTAVAQVIRVLPWRTASDARRCGVRRRVRVRVDWATAREAHCGTNAVVSGAWPPAAARGRPAEALPREALGVPRHRACGASAGGVLCAEFPRWARGAAGGSDKVAGDAHARYGTALRLKRRQGCDHHPCHYQIHHPHPAGNVLRRCVHSAVVMNEGRI